MTVEPRTLRWLTAERLTTSGSDEGASALSWDGTRLAFTITGGPTRLWAFALDTTGGRFADRGKPITEEGADVNDFDLSRDGRTVAHQMLRPGHQESELWTTDLDSGRSELIAKNAGGPRWSFDGARLAYYTWGTTAADPFRLLVRDSTRGDRTIARLSDGRLAFPLDWTPDDAAVLASWAASRSGTWALTLWPATRGVAEKPERILLSDARGSLWQGRFSPNGRWVSFVVVDADAAGRTSVLIAPAVGAPRDRWIEVAPGHALADKPRWSVDGRTLYFISTRPTSLFNLWGVRFDPEAGKTVGQPFVLSHFDSPGRMISPHTDRTELGIASRRAVIALRSVSGSIWMLDNVDK